MSVQIDKLIQHSRDSHRVFEEMIQHHRSSLWKYCLYLTRSPWDGDDLFQETLLKAFATLPQIWQKLQERSYLFRIATNTWIDQCRKRRVKLDVFDEEVIIDFSHNEPDPIEITEALEILIDHLSPKQVAILLLMEVFQFTSKEVAEMFNTTEGAVYSLLHRGRAKLKTINHLKEDLNMGGTQNSPVVHRTLQLYAKAISEGNAEAMLSLMSQNIHVDATPGFQEYSKEDVRNGSLVHGGPKGVQASFHTLWGKPVMVVLAKTEKGLALHDISLQEVVEDEIVYHKSYFFRREFLSYSAKELNVPLQLNKPPVNWEGITT